MLSAPPHTEANFGHLHKMDDFDVIREGNSFQRASSECNSECSSDCESDLTIGSLSLSQDLSKVGGMLSCLKSYSPQKRSAC